MRCAAVMMNILLWLIRLQEWGSNEDENEKPHETHLIKKKLIWVIFHLQSAVAVCERIRAQSFFRGHREIQFAVVCDVTRFRFNYDLMITSQYIHIICSNMFMWLLVWYIQVSALSGFCLFFVAFQQSSSDDVSNFQNLPKMLVGWHKGVLEDLEKAQVDFEFSFKNCKKCWFCLL